MSFPRHREIFPSDGDAGFAANVPAHRLDEFPAGYSLAGCSPAWPASASPAGHQYAVMSSCRSRSFQRTANCVLTVCVGERFHLSKLVLLGLVAALVAPVTKADPEYKRTEVTFHQPVEIPGQVLMPGTYVMKLLDPYMERNVVRFYNAQENHMYAMVFAIPAYRLTTTDHTVITFEERAHNAPQAIKEWFPAGDNWGEEFVYGKAQPVIAASTPSTPPPASAAGRSRGTSSGSRGQTGPGRDASQARPLNHQLKSPRLSPHRSRQPHRRQPRARNCQKPPATCHW